MNVCPMGGKENLSHIRESLEEALPHTTERQRWSEFSGKQTDTWCPVTLSSLKLIKD